MTESELEMNRVAYTGAFTDMLGLTVTQNNISIAPPFRISAPPGSIGTLSMALLDDSGVIGSIETGEITFENALHQLGGEVHAHDNYDTLHVAGASNELIITSSAPDNSLTLSYSTDGSYGFDVRNASTEAPSMFAYHNMGLTQYELSNHLGNVQTTVSNRFLFGDSTEVKLADIYTYADYYAFGSLKAGRYYNSDDYSFLFNGMEKDNEIAGVGNSYTTLYRQYNPRLGRWKSVDPAANLMPWQSPYVGMDNKPIIRNDEQGDCPTCISAAIGAGVGALMEMVIQVGDHMSQGDDFETALSKINYVDVGKEAAIGGLAGLSGFGAAKYIGKATKFLKSPAAQKILPLLGEMGVDAAVSMVASMGYDASGLEKTLYNAMGYEQLGINQIGNIAEAATKSDLVAKYGDNAVIGEQVYGSFGEGKGGTYFDFVVKDKKTGEILEVVESKANSAKLSAGQKKYCSNGQSVTFTGKQADKLGIVGKTASKNSVTSNVSRRAVNKFTGKVSKTGVSSVLKKRIRYR